MVTIKFNEVFTSEELEAFNRVAHHLNPSNVGSVVAINFPESGGVYATLGSGGFRRDQGTKRPSTMSKFSQDCRALINMKMEAKMEEYQSLYELSKSF